MHSRVCVNTTAMLKIEIYLTKRQTNWYDFVNPGRCHHFSLVSVCGIYKNRLSKMKFNKIDHVMHNHTEPPKLYV